LLSGLKRSLGVANLFVEVVEAKVTVLGAIIFIAKPDDYSSDFKTVWAFSALAANSSR
jgi:hypothetical protein